MAQTSTSQPVHPAIVFEVDLSLNATESIGPNTNVSNPHMLHPGGFPDSTLTAALRSAHLEGVTHIDDGDLDMDGDGISEGDIMIRGQKGHGELSHGDKFTLYGKAAIDFRALYADGYGLADRAWVTEFSYNGVEIV